jgi:hypothetical protein
MKRLWTLTAATIAILGMLFIPLLLTTPTLPSAALTNATMLALRDGPMAQENLALETYPHYNVLPDDIIRYSTHRLTYGWE